MEGFGNVWLIDSSFLFSLPNLSHEVFPYHRSHCLHVSTTKSERVCEKQKKSQNMQESCNSKVLAGRGKRD